MCAPSRAPHVPLLPCAPLATAQVPFGCHGYGCFFTLSTMDRYYHPDMTLTEVRLRKPRLVVCELSSMPLL